MSNSLINRGGGDPAPSTSTQTEDRRVWMYRGTEAKLFNSPEEVPEGWTDAPTEDAVEPQPEAPKRKVRAKPVEESEPDSEGE